MNELIRSVQKKFISVIMIVVLVVVFATWGVLQIVSARQIGNRSTLEEVRSTAAQDKDLAEYIRSQQKYEAHFVNLTTSIKKQEQDRLSVALAVTSAVMIIVGAASAFIASKKLMKPVSDAYMSQERFLQDAAHELRNPLATMTIALQQAESHGLTQPLIDMFRRQTLRMVNINEDLLFLERQTNSKLLPVDISFLLQDVVEEALPMARSRGMRIITKTEPTIIKNILPEDYVRMIKNIVENAIKYSPDKSIIRVNQIVEKNTAVVTIKDKGIGIPRDEVKYIGDRFYRAKNVGMIDGTGLGLAIVNKILMRYKGVLRITEGSHGGTTVTIKIPL
jgi:two-component system, OmpR family, sensor histidine kinase CiaH